MPIYEYACDKCGKLNEVIQKVSDPAPAECDGCKAAGSLVKVVSRSSFHLKGGGWYSDLYGSTKKGAGKTGSDAAPGSGNGAKTETKAETKTESTSSTSGTSGTSAPSTPAPAKSSDSSSKT